MFQDLLKLVTSVLRLDCEGSFGNLDAQDVRDHVGAQPADQRGGAGGVVGLSVVEKETIHLQEGNESQCGYS